jgi:bifunctional non-homologous end joining protein LigD
MNDKQRPASARIEIDGRELTLSNLDKVLYPETGTTKRHVLDYYRTIAPTLLPHLRDRPLVMKRFPDGVTGPSFYEKQCPPWRPDWVTTASVYSESKQHDIDYCVIDDLATLLWVVNLADLEMHSFLATTTELTKPTMVVFDLDPGPGAGLVQCAQVALWLRDTLDLLGLRSLVKSSGSKGLHLHLPLNVPVTYEQTKPFAHASAALIERQHPGQVVSRMAKQHRRDRVLIDWSQNSAHKSTVVPFSLRAQERPTVAAPLSWPAVEAVANGQADPESLRLEASDIGERHEQLRELFQPALDVKQELPSFAR